MRKTLGGKGLTKYSAIRVIKNFALSQLRSEYVEVQGNKMHLDAKDCLQLSINEIFEPIETNIIKREIQNGDIVLDIGANIGYYTLMMAKSVGKKGKVFAFEPEPSNFNILKKNVAINKYDNIVLEQKAVGNKNGRTKLYLSEKDTVRHATHKSKWCKDSLEVDIVKLDDYFGNNVERIDFIKVDVEGGEIDVFKGMLKILQNNKRIKMLVEFIPEHIIERGSKPEELLQFLITQDFKLSRINEQEKVFVPINSFKEILELDFNGRNLFCERV